MRNELHCEFLKYNYWMILTMFVSKKNAVSIIDATI